MQWAAAVVRDGGGREVRRDGVAGTRHAGSSRRRLAGSLRRWWEVGYRAQRRWAWTWRPYGRSLPAVVYRIGIGAEPGEGMGAGRRRGQGRDWYMRTAGAGYEMGVRFDGAMEEQTEEKQDENKSQRSDERRVGKECSW